MSKKPKKNKDPESNMGKEIDYNTKDIRIYDIDKIDKVYKDIIEATEKIQVLLKKPSISGSPLEVEKKGITNYILKNKAKYNPKKKFLITNNKENFKGKTQEEVNNDKIYIYLENGVYTWPSKEKYLGQFNKNNEFDGKGTLSKEGGDVKYSFESIFSNGYPVKEGIFKLSKKNLYDLYIQSDIVKNGNENSPFKLVLNGKTNITKTQGGREVYRFDGEIKNQKIVGIAKIKREYKVTRIVEINLNFTKNERVSNVQNLEMEIIDTKPKNTFHYKANYVNGLKTGLFTLIDQKEHIFAKDQKSLELISILTKLKHKMLVSSGGMPFELIYRQKLDKIRLFNRIFKTNVDKSNQLIHVIGKDLKTEGLYYLCNEELTNLKELSLCDSKITDISPLEKANFPLLETLSLGKNKITSIESIIRLNCPKLKNILLGVNQIKDISPLKQYKSPILSILALFENYISDITPLTKINAPNLEQISLGSHIQDITPLTKCNFPELKQLGLKSNKIKNISALKNVNFPKLEILYLNYNEIIDINPLKTANFQNLSKLGLDHNKIKKINPLSYLKCSKLNFLNISHNSFRPTSANNKEEIEYLKKKYKNIFV